MSVFSTLLCYSMVPFSYRQAEADCTSAIDLDPKVRSCFFVFSAFAFYYRAMCNGCYSNVFNTCEIRMEPTILQFVLELYGCAVGKHPNDFLLYLSLVDLVQILKQCTHLILVDVSIGNAIFPQNNRFAIYYIF